MATWVMYAASSCVDSLVRRSALGFYLYPPMACAVRWMTTWLPMDELRAVGETSAGKNQNGNDDSDADWTIDSEGRSSLFWRKCVRTGGA